MSARPHDLEHAAHDAFLAGRDAEAIDLLTRAFQAATADGNPVGAARIAFWITFHLVHQGDHAPAAGWVARGRRLLDEAGADCVERGYLLLPDAVRHTREGNPAAAATVFAEAASIGTRFGDRDLIILARHGVGRAMVATGRVDDGIALLDEIMVEVTSGEVSPIIAGTVYCSVISACCDLFDLRRAQEWTAALSRWCDARPDLVAYRGQCMVRRSELMQLHGEWDRAQQEAEAARARLTDPPDQPDAGAAWYQEGEMLRLRGRAREAERAYRLANHHGRRPQPGLALLRLAQGRARDAHATLREMLEEARGRPIRVRLLAAWVEVALACDEVDAAEAAAEELSEAARSYDRRWLTAIAARARGAVLLARGRPREALAVLRESGDAWRALEAPHSLAQTQVLIAEACQTLGDHDTAELERDAARQVFELLGAEPDLQRLGGDPVRPGGLTPREVEVLREVAAGGTNRAVADALGISEKTVARHLSNIFLKLGVESRAAATAWAYEHRVV